MMSLLSSFGSNKPTVTKKPLMNSRPKTFAKPQTRFEDEEETGLFVKEEPVLQTLPVQFDDPMEDAEFDDILDDDMVFDEDFLKKEVDNLTIRDSVKPNFTTLNKNDPRPDLQSWKTAEASMVDTFNQDDIKFDTKQMDIFESDGHLRMWWYDAYERKEKGYVYVFGKVLNKKTKKYVSCCVTVKNIERNLFILPRKFELNGKLYLNKKKIMI